MISRQESRYASAQYLNTLDKETLFRRFEITRVAEITGYDLIGVPVFSCARPAGKVISVSAGKSRDRSLARAGAVAEGIEFHTFENPLGEFSVQKIGKDFGFPTCKNSKWTPETPVATETVTHYASGREVLFPSELVWMTRRVPGSERHFMRSSTGQALGGSFADAFLQGLYEVVERDQLTLRKISWQCLRVAPTRTVIPTSFHRIQEILSQASQNLYLFNCTFDIKIPCYWAIITGYGGAFAGWGCNLSHDLAAERAILEAIQSRCVWISGARDDISRRDWKQHAERSPKAVQAELDALPTTAFSPPEVLAGMAIEDELAVVLHKLRAWQNNIYYKHIDLGDLHAVKVMILGLECLMTSEDEHLWRPIRYSTLVQAYLDECQRNGTENSGVAQRLKAISFET